MRSRSTTPSVVVATAATVTVKWDQEFIVFVGG